MLLEQLDEALKDNARPELVGETLTTLDTIIEFIRQRGQQPSKRYLDAQRALRERTKSYRGVEVQRCINGENRWIASLERPYDSRRAIYH